MGLGETADQRPVIPAPPVVTQEDAAETEAGQPGELWQAALPEIDARQVPGGDLWQIFVNDPNGAMIELNYEAAREQGGSAPVERADDVGAR